LGSVTVIELASGASASKVTWPVTVTLVGETERVEPLIGLVLTNVFAETFVTPKNVSSKIAAIRVRLTFPFRKDLGSPSIRAYRLTSLHLLPSLNYRMETVMPTYQYACTACDHEFEAIQSFSDDSLTECPLCKGEIRKVYTAVGVVFKGSGFYKTDSVKKSTVADVPKVAPAPKAD
jgi:putative FmdB family regulatory protein